MPRKSLVAWLLASVAVAAAALAIFLWPPDDEMRVYRAFIAPVAARPGARVHFESAVTTCRPPGQPADGNSYATQILEAANGPGVRSRSLEGLQQFASPPPDRLGTEVITYRLSRVAIANYGTVAVFCFEDHAQGMLVVMHKSLLHGWVLGGVSELWVR
jgi:hypothetical protein